MDLNVVVVTGNLTADPEMSKMQSGREKCSFRIANNGYGEKVNYLPIVVWGNLAQPCFKNLKKGRRVVVRGRVEIRSFEGKEGTTQKITEIIADEVIFVGSPNAQQPPEIERPRYVHESNFPKGKQMEIGKSVDEDDLPF